MTTRIFLSFMLLMTPQFADAQPNQNAGAIELQKYLTENFGIPGYATTWFPAIRSVRVDGAVAVAQVTVASQASSICSAVSGFVYDRTRKHGLTGVRIVDPKGAVLIMRRSVADPCR